MSVPRRVLLLSLGGTIAMVAGEQGLVPSLDGSELLEEIVDPDIAVTARALRQVPSAHLGFGDIAEVARAASGAAADGFDAVVVTQGTDTLEESAFLLDLLLEPQAMPVVVTGALRGAGTLGADGPANLRAALRVAASPGAAGRGVVVVLNDVVHAARWVTKSHASRPDAFQSPGYGSLAEIVEDRVCWHSPCLPQVGADRGPAPGAWPGVPRVLVVSTGLGDDGALLVAALSTEPDGLVIEGLGAGHVPPALVQPLHDAAARIPVLLTSATGAGEVHTSTYDYFGSEIGLLGSGIINGRGLSARKARILLTVALASGWERAELDARIS